MKYRKKTKNASHQNKTSKKRLTLWTFNHFAKIDVTSTLSSKNSDECRLEDGNRCTTELISTEASVEVKAPGLVSIPIKFTPVARISSERAQNVNKQYGIREVAPRQGLRGISTLCSGQRALYLYISAYMYNPWRQNHCDRFEDRTKLVISFTYSDSQLFGLCCFQQQ